MDQPVMLNSADALGPIPGDLSAPSTPPATASDLKALVLNQISATINDLQTADLNDSSAGLPHLVNYHRARKDILVQLQAWLNSIQTA